MKRLCSLLLLLSLLSGCAAPGEADAAFSFSDDLGRTVSIPARAERVACLLGSFAEVWILSGGTPIAAPDDAWEDLALPMLEDATVLGSAKHLSLELLLSSDPDFVLASTNTPAHLEYREALESAGIPVAYFQVSNFQDYLRLLKLCTTLTGRQDLYEQHGAAVAQQVDQAKSFAAGQIAQTGHAPTVLYLRLAASGVRVKGSQGSILGQMLLDLGCENIADTPGTALENLSMEHILLADPDHIFLVPQGDDVQGTQEAFDAFLREHPAWHALTAVRENRVHTLDKRRYSLKPNALWGQAMLELTEVLWP